MQSISFRAVATNDGQVVAIQIVSRETRRLNREVLRLAVTQLSRQAKTQLRWMGHHRRNGNVSLTSRYYGISRQIFYAWYLWYDPAKLSSLEGRSSRPARMRTWTRKQILAVKTMREQYPRWDEVKLVILLRQQGVDLSTSMVGRILR